MGTVETFGPARNGCQWVNHTWGFSSRLKQRRERHTSPLVVINKNGAFLQHVQISLRQPTRCHERGDADTEDGVGWSDNCARHRLDALIRQGWRTTRQGLHQLGA